MSLYLTPYRRMTGLRDAMDRLFDESFFRPFVEVETGGLPLDIQAKADEFVVTAAVPGYKPEEIEVNVLDNSLTIKAAHKEERTEETNGYLLRELRSGSFSRQVSLPAPVDAGKVEASVADGLLTLRLPKAESAKIKSIKVKAK